jgi:hypothetical protein
MFMASSVVMVLGRALFFLPAGSGDLDTIRPGPAPFQIPQGD